MRSLVVISLMVLSCLSFSQEGDSIIVYAPNIATPDCCEFPCEWRVYAGSELEDFQLTVYDHWGEPVFESDDIEKGWDFYESKTSALLVPDGVYFWVLKFTEFKDHDFDGDIELGTTEINGKVTVLK